MLTNQWRFPLRPSMWEPSMDLHRSSYHTRNSIRARPTNIICLICPNWISLSCAFFSYLATPVAHRFNRLLRSSIFVRITIRFANERWNETIPIRLIRLNCAISEAENRILIFDSRQDNIFRLIFAHFFHIHDRYIIHDRSSSSCRNRATATLHVSHYLIQSHISSFLSRDFRNHESTACY